MAYAEDDVTAGLMAVLCTTTFQGASDLLAEQGQRIPARTLDRWCKDQHVVRFEKLREQYAPRIEAQLANDLLSNARLAAETERMAIEAARIELENGSAKEPSKIARDLSQVKSQSVDKRLSLQGRPTQITEKRDINEIVRALVGLKVVSVTAPEHVADATASSIQPRQLTPSTSKSVQTVGVDPEPVKVKRPGAMVWSDEAGEMVYESFSDREGVPS